MFRAAFARWVLLVLIPVAVLCLAAGSAYASDRNSELEDRIKKLEETLKKQEQTIQELKILEETLKKQEQTIAEQKKVIEEVKAGAKQSQPAAPPSAAAATQTAAPGQMQQQVQELKEKVEQVVETQKKSVLSVFNPSIGFVSETIFCYSNKGSNVTGNDRAGGFDVFQRSMELNLAASVDPFARGYAVFNASADPITGEATATVEEAAIVTTSLPWNLTLKGGRFFGEFGRLSYIHDHELPFVTRPRVLDEYIGGESLTNGLQLNYLLPIPHYVSLTAGVGNQFGSPPDNVGDFRPFLGLNFWGRTSTYFDLTPDISLEPGVSGLLNPKTNYPGGALSLPNGSTLTERERRVVGTDLMVRYQPLRNNQFQSLTWGTELLYSDNSYDINSPGSPVFGETVGSFGLYSYLTYKFHRQWSAGFEFQWVQDVLNSRDQTYSYSPYITWAISHWNQLRLQYTHTDRSLLSGLGPDDAVFLQWVWIIGSHSHGWDAR